MTMPGPFKDHFSALAADYQRYRPGYPEALFDWLAALAPARDLALDVATGSGQAAVGLARHFRRVRATDPSAAQLARAARHPRIDYALETAESIALPDASVDLLAAAQAAHWFDGPRFFAEARRVLRPGGVIALWTYEKFRVDARVDTLVDDFYRDVVGPYWPRERRHVEEGYRSLGFPLAQLAAPPFALETSWDADTALAYLGTWSAVQRYREARGRDPLERIAPLLREVWGQAERPMRWPIHLCVARVG